MSGGPNTSAAVMAQRSEARDSLDDFPTPPWATRALCRWLGERGIAAPGQTAREPCAGRGYMAGVLEEYFGAGQVDASDVHDYGRGFPARDYLEGPPPPPVDWTIANPPFRLAERFVARALVSSRRGVAVFERTTFLEGIGRHCRLFSVSPPAAVLQFAERVPIHKGRLAPKGSTATAYCWIVWTKKQPRVRSAPMEPTTFHWIPPCRKALERPDDYNSAPE